MFVLLFVVALAVAVGLLFNRPAHSAGPVPGPAKGSRAQGLKGSRAPGLKGSRAQGPNGAGNEAQGPPDRAQDRPKVAPGGGPGPPMEEQKRSKKARFRVRSTLWQGAVPASGRGAQCGKTSYTEQRTLGQFQSAFRQSPWGHLCAPPMGEWAPRRDQKKGAGDTGTSPRSIIDGSWGGGPGAPEGTRNPSPGSPT